MPSNSTETKSGSCLVEKINNLELGEPKVDCGRCQIAGDLKREERPRPHKCCTHFPFWSAYQAGAYLESGEKWPLGETEAVFLPVGVVPRKDQRSLQESLAWGSRSNHPKMICSYYEKETGSCGIFKFRPLECRRYFCASGIPKAFQYRQKVFDWSHSILREGLEETLIGLGYSKLDWKIWSEHLEAPGWRKSPHKEFSNLEEATLFYRLVFKSWPRSLGRDLEVPPFSVLMGRHGKSYC